MKKIWQSQANSPSPADAETIKRDFLSRLKRRYRQALGFFLWIFGALTWFTGVVVYQSIQRGNIHLDREWALIPLFLLPWLAAFIFLRQFLQHRRHHAHYQDSILATLRAMQDENRLAMRRIKGIVLLHGLLILPLSLMIQQLFLSGKMNRQALLSMVALFTLLGILSLGAMAWEYFRKLLPRQKQTENLLASYQEN